jgi:hypothetical protein
VTNSKVGVEMVVVKAVEYEPGALNRIFSGFEIEEVCPFPNTHE